MLDAETVAGLGVRLDNLERELDAICFETRPAEAAAKRAEWNEAGLRIARTPATDLAGIAVKARIVILGMADGETVFSDAVARSLWADLDRLAPAADRREPGMWACLEPGENRLA